MGLQNGGGGGGSSLNPEKRGGGKMRGAQQILNTVVT